MLLPFFADDDTDTSVVCDVLSDVELLGSVILFDLRSECVYEDEAKEDEDDDEEEEKENVVRVRERTMSRE